ncbi:triose-phosphate isomerase [Neomicrococcus lactis]|uniref:Triosephosphate isomerase n=1 Tax=Neomicrococcus lactis TaxID=732241 RepID=A0A7W8YAA4_9MICC|nr:triose-phosphate isomerase [Neomicrococcus lactis]MBB5597863.1 triosephosphate isomerase [Neomicrococcus lactis]
MAIIRNKEFVRRPLIAGNWKMNMDHVQGITLLQKLEWTLDDAKHDFKRVEVAVFPPFTDLRGVQTLVAGDDLDVVYGAQDLSPFDEGAYTGDISGQFLSRLGCSYVLVGHSERRSIHGESNEVVASKLAAALKHSLTPILCVGEGLEVRQSGEHVAFTVQQLRESLEGYPASAAEKLVVAYEPVWAIGTGEVAGPEDAQEMASALRAELVELFGEAAGESVRVLYGGSVKAANAAALMQEKDVDGLLVGGASLDAGEFANIVRFEKHFGSA